MEANIDGKKYHNVDTFIMQPTVEDKFATELLHEVKASAKRWFIAFIVVLCLWFATIGAFLWYISLPVEVTETSSVEQQSDNNSNNYVVGGDYDGGLSERELQEDSSENNEK